MTNETRIAIAAGVFLTALAGWAVGGIGGWLVGLIAGLVLLVLPWRGQPVWSWAWLYLARNRTLALGEPTTATNDRSGGGVRYQGHLVCAAVQVLGKAHRPTLLTGSTSARTENTLDIHRLLPLMRHSLGLTIDSLSVVSAGSRRYASGDYAAVYDTLIGPAPYAGRRETWLILRIDITRNGDALQWRSTAGAAVLAVAQRIASALRTEGVRAKVATAIEIADLDRRLGSSALDTLNRRWHSLRGDAGWMTTYAYRTDDLRAETLGQAWSLRADGVIQNITLFPDGTACASVTIQTPKPPTASPSLTLKTLPGEQAQALMSNMCGPLGKVRGRQRGPLPHCLSIPIAPSGVLIGKLGNGDRLLLPLADSSDTCRIQISADDAITKRLIARLAATGERITVHTDDPRRWDSVRMQNLTVTDKPRPMPGTTVSVVDGVLNGTLSPTPRPNTVILVGAAGVHGPAEVIIDQSGPDTVDVTTSSGSHRVGVEFFRAENRFAATDFEIAV